MNGLWIKENGHFAVLLEPLLPKFEALWWYVNCQTGPISSSLKYENEVLWKFYDDCFFDVESLRKTSASVWRPGSLPLLAPEIYLDENSGLVGFAAKEDEVATLVEKMSAVDDEEYYRVLEQHAAIEIFNIDDGMLFVYSTREGWLELLHQRWPQSEYVDSSKWWCEWTAEQQRAMAEVIELTRKQNEEQATNDF